MKDCLKEEQKNCYWIIILIFNSFIFKENHLKEFLIWQFQIFLNWKYWLLKINHYIQQLVLLYQVYSNWCLYNELIFLNYLHSLQVIIHSMKQLVLLYQVYSYWCLYNELIFLIYLHLLQVEDHSMKQLVLLYQVYSHPFSLSSTDVPFKNGKYTHGQKEGYAPAFVSLSRSSIQSDSSLFLIIHFIHSLYKSKTTNIISFR